MKIQIIRDANTKLSFSLPTSLIKRRIVWKRVLKNSFVDIKKIKKIYPKIKKYIKENGHFSLVEVQSHNGECVKIII